VAHKYTPRELRFIKSKISNHSYAEVAELFNKRFGLSVTANQIGSVLVYYKLGGNGKNHRYTPKEIRFLTSKVAGRSYAELTALFNKRFKLSMNKNQISSTLKRFNLSNGRDCCFRPGNIPVHKIRKGMHLSRKTEFKKGHRPHNWQPVGFERINGDGYVDVKIADPNKWKAKHILIWEAANGKVPKGHAIIFADKNRLNLALENLLMVSRGELAVMNHTGLIYDDADSTKTGKTIADIKIKIADRKRGMKKRSMRMTTKQPKFSVLLENTIMGYLRVTLQGVTEKQFSFLQKGVKETIAAAIDEYTKAPQKQEN
jgi:hypothetical protein